MKMKIGLFLVSFMFSLILLVGIVSAQDFYGSRSGTASYVNYGSDFRTYYTTQNVRDYWPILYENDANTCVGRQDLLIQVAPLGCQPAVVRSDLLAEQNVPVFCQLDSFRVNPLVDVKQIRNVRFSFAGDKPDEVIDVGFHPAQAALQTRNELVGSPVLNNIGYVVVVLKKNENESSLPEMVNFTLGASLEYTAGNALGIGRTSFLLRPVNDEQWKIEQNRQSFFKGQYSVRAEEVDSARARVAIYRGDRKIATTTVNFGSTSSDIYLEGGYCQSRIQIAYDKYGSADETIKLQVDDDILQLSEGSSFMNEKCRVSTINSEGSDAGSAKIVCGRDSIDLRLSSKQLDKDDEVIVIDESGRVAQSGNWIIESVNGPTGDVKETNYDLVKVGEINTKLKNVAARFIRSASENKLLEPVYEKEVEDAFKKSIAGYRELAENYPDARKSGLDKSYGEQALERAIDMAHDFKKQKTEVELINLYLQRYPDASNSSYYLSRLDYDYRFDTSQAVVSVEVDNSVHTIHLLEVREPERSSKAIFSWGSTRIDASLRGSYGIENFGNFTLDRIDEESTSVTAYCYNANDKTYIKDKQYTLRIREGDDSQQTVSVCGRVLKLENVELEKFAQIRILPSVHNTNVQTNFSVGIGIEKRAIKLTPDKTKERIDELNKTIKKWDQISTNLGNVVKTMKAACFATAGVLTVKNFVTGLSGEALARQKVMRSSGGWTEWCTNEVNNKHYSSIGQCYSENSGKIDNDVHAMGEIINADNSKIENIEGRNDVKTSDDVFGSSIDGSRARDLFVNEQLASKSSETVNVSGKLVSVGDLTRDVNGQKQLSYEEAKDLSLYLEMRERAGDSPVAKQLAEKNLARVGTAVQDRISFEQVKGNLDGVHSYDVSNRINNAVYSGKTIADLKSQGTLSVGDAGPFDDSDPAEIVSYGNKLYLVTFDSVPTSSGNYRVKNAYEATASNSGDKASVSIGADKTGDITSSFNTFKQYSSSDCRNQFKNPEVKFYETEPYKGLPALVPFDLEAGWYAATQQTLPGFGNIKAFQSNGKPASFWVCNVGPNGQSDFFVSGFGDDICQRFDADTGAPVDKFACLDESATKQVVQRGQRALEDAARQRSQGRTSQMNIEGRNVKVGEPAVNLPGTQCQDFMSPDDCKLLFNVCDPVICPASRCNLGGLYPVQDVIQTGIVGSALLCLPNAKEGIAVPVCLTGIKAGIDGYLSIMKSHQQCLQESLDTGRSVGTCDLINSVYLCEFFWRQAAPVANILLPKLVEFAYGQSQARGGGEYATVQSSWDNAQASVNYFTQSYATNSLNAFNIRSVEEAGSDVCRAFISAKGPNQFESLIEPDSPPQFHAWFSSIPYSDATVPATSQYKVFYHIFAGNDRGVSFSVYLKDPPQSSYYQSQPTVLIANGFISKGEFATETRDFTAPLGYQQLCVRINDKEECGFKEVSTSFAVNYVRDKFVSDEIKRTGITSSKSCVSGEINPSALLNPNVQEGAQEALNPDVYNRGITRICATDNPGRSTDPLRFVDVGYCDDQGVRCWLDQQSVDKAVTANNVGIRNETLSVIDSRAREQLKQAAEDDGYFVVDTTEDEIKKIVDVNKQPFIVDSAQEGERKAQSLSDLQTRVVFNSQKAQVLYVKNLIYESVARLLFGGNTPKISNPEIGVSSTSNTNSNTQSKSDLELSRPKEVTDLNRFVLSSSYSNLNTIMLYDFKLTSPEYSYIRIESGKILFNPQGFLNEEQIGFVDSDKSIIRLYETSKYQLEQKGKGEYYTLLRGASIRGKSVVPFDGIYIPLYEFIKVGNEDLRLYKDGVPTGIYRRDSIVYYSDNLGERETVGRIDGDVMSFTKPYEAISTKVSKENYALLNGARLEGNIVIIPTPGQIEKSS